MGWYLYSFMAGIATALIVAAVAVFDPEMEENPAEARIVVTARPPRRCPNHASAAWNSRSLYPAWKITSPSSTKSGITVKP